MRGFFKRFVPVCMGLFLLFQAAMASSTLELGSSGTAVSRLQQALTALGYTLKSDGVYGSQTRNAVKSFQADHQLKVDGKAGDQTQALLYALEAQKGSAVSAPAATAAVSAAGQQAMVYCSNGGKLNLRTGAGTGYKSIDKIPTGDWVVVLSNSGKWSYISYNGETGYVMSSFLRAGTGTAATAAPAATSAPAAASAVQAIVSCADGGKLNLRQTAGSGAKILERIPNGTPLTVYPAGGKWYNTTYNGQSGYVQAGFLDFSAASSSAQVPTATAAPAVMVAPTAVPANAVNATVRCNGNLNLRATASSSGKVLGRIPNGTVITAQPVDSKWYAVTYNGQSGYVMAQYLQTAGGGTAAAAAGGSQAVTVSAESSLRFEEFRYATVHTTGGGLNVRKGPGENYSRVSELQNGTRIVISSIQGNWCAMYYGDIQGYVQRQYLTIQEANGTVQTAAVSSGGSYSSYSIDYNGNTSSAKTTAVRNAQYKLRDLGYNVPLTGAFEARTHDAIVAFQLRNGLTASGVLDSATQSALYSSSARDAVSPSRFYLSPSAGTGIAAPTNVQLLHWNNEVSGLLSGQKSVLAYDPATRLSWTLSILSLGRHLDVEPASLTDTMIQKKSFGGTSWDVHPVYIRMPDGRWTLATMHDYPHGTNTIKDNGFGGQNCVHFLRDMSEAQKNDPSYGVRNQEVLRSTCYSMTGITVAN
ncbi:MAG: SH3 domain-containing protein [Clostridia bacterium]|nr:SH3 domain-containing protein [Clostridia bacterium]